MGRFTDKQSIPPMPWEIHDLGTTGEARLQQQSFRNDAIRDRVGLYGDDQVVDPDCYGEVEDGWDAPMSTYTEPDQAGY